MGKRFIRPDRSLYTINEAMVLMHISSKAAFMHAYIDSGLVGVYLEPGTGRMLIPRMELEAVILKRLTFRNRPVYSITDLLAVKKSVKSKNAQMFRPGRKKWW